MGRSSAWFGLVCTWSDLFIRWISYELVWFDVVGFDMSWYSFNWFALGFVRLMTWYGYKLAWFGLI